jgi:hypothetical protein
VDDWLRALLWRNRNACAWQRFAGAALVTAEERHQQPRDKGTPQQSWYALNGAALMDSRGITMAQASQRSFTRAS